MALLSHSQTSIRRSHLDGNPTIGSLFDLQTDSVVGQLADLDGFNISQFTPLFGQCLSTHLNEFDKNRFFSNIGLTDSPTFDLEKEHVSQVYHMNELTNFRFPSGDEFHVLYFEYTSVVESLWSEGIKHDFIETATHALTRIHHGIQIFLVVEVEYSVQDQFESLVERINLMLEENAQVKLSHGDYQILQSILVTAVFTNFRQKPIDLDLRKIIDLLVKMIPFTDLHIPFLYELDAVQCFSNARKFHFERNLHPFTPTRRGNQTNDTHLQMENSDSSDTQEDSNRSYFEQFFAPIIYTVRMVFMYLRQMLPGLSKPEFIQRYISSTRLIEFNIDKTRSIPERSTSDEPSDTSVEFSDDSINFLILGESGVGKSTFINALVNYLTFNSLDEAIEKDRVIVLPISFPLAIGDDFEEKIIQFGEFDSNENPNGIGESVTQECRSYVFSYRGRSIRIIDTPGIGDTRGVQQDDRNLNNILSYISQLTHLNGICILFKSDKARLDVVTRNYFQRFISFLGNDVSKNVIFGFTNTRLSFYTPGNSGSLIRGMLNRSSNLAINYTKENVFCFDSEAMRYLIALHNQIDFSPEEHKEYEHSWTRSVREAKRLLELGIKPNFESFRQNWKSIEHASMMIDKLSKPILVELRHCLRNITIHENRTSDRKICFKWTSFDQRVKARDLSDVKIQSLNKMHVLSVDKVKTNGHDNLIFLIDDAFEYYVETRSAIDLEEFPSILANLRRILLYFGYYQSKYVHQHRPFDRILSQLDLMINEENMICNEFNEIQLNHYVLDELIKIRREYMESRHPKNENIVDDLSHVYEMIKMAESIPSVDTWLKYERKSQWQRIMSTEKHVNIDRPNTD